MRVALVLGLLLLLPTVVAQSEKPNQGGTPPTLSNGTNGTPMAGPEESLEDAPGVTYGVLVLIGTLAFLGVVGYLAARYRRERPGGPGGP